MLDRAEAACQQQAQRPKTAVWWLLLLPAMLQHTKGTVTTLKHVEFGFTVKHASEKLAHNAELADSDHLAPVYSCSV